jgi:cell division protein FtsB
MAMAIIACVGTIFFARSGYEAYVKNRAIEQEIAAMEAEAEAFSRQNEALHKKIAYFQSEAFAEREAKEKLRLKRPEEKMVIVKGRSTGDDEAALPLSEYGNFAKTPPYKQWQHIFFGYEY